MTTEELILTIAYQANQLRLAIEELLRLQRRIAELEAMTHPPADPAQHHHPA